MRSAILVIVATALVVLVGCSSDVTDVSRRVDSVSFVRSLDTTFINGVMHVSIYDWSDIVYDDHNSYTDTTYYEVLVNDSVINVPVANYGSGGVVEVKHHSSIRVCNRGSATFLIDTISMNKMTLHAPAR